MILNNLRSFPRKTASCILLALFLLIKASLGLSATALGEHEPPSHLSSSGTPEIFLESFFRNREVYAEAFAKIKDLKKTRIKAGLVCHHFLAKDLIGEFFAGIAAKDVKRVILVGPDHFRIEAHQPPTCFTSARPWKTPFGPVEPDGELIQELIKIAGAVPNDRIFMREHSIYTLVPFIKKALPDAKLVPIILPPEADYGKFLKLERTLRQLSPNGTIMIVSSDFAHEVNQGTARRLDQKSILSLKNLNEKNISRITCDCRPGLATLLGFLGKTTQKFLLLSNKTSLDFGSDTPNNLTSYITAYYLEEENPEITLLFLGDLMFDREIRKIAARKGNDFILREMKNYLLENDLVIANLEGPITDKPSVSLTSKRGGKNNYIFTFPQTLPKTLKEHNITVVNLGNNHLGDFGKEGIKQTRKCLSASEITYFGDPEDKTRRFVIKNIAGVKIGLVNYNQFAKMGVENTLKDITRVSHQADLVILYAHWGSEYDRHPGDRTRRLAHKFIDHGADLIIGSHPHMVQDKEEYQGKMIYYSLGNFIFDQYFRNDACQGLAVKVKINPANLHLKLGEVPLYLERNGQTKIKRILPE